MEDQGLQSLLSRRDFIRELGALSAASLTFWAGGCESCVRQIQNRPTRKNIQELWAANPSDPVISTYKNAVSAMKALPSSVTLEVGKVRRRSTTTSASTETGCGCLGIAFTWFTSSASVAS